MKKVILALVVMFALTMTSVAFANHKDVCKHVKQERRQSVQCMGITKSGYRCQRMTYNYSGYCNLHQ
jgi:hypothetical protein